MSQTKNKETYCLTQYEARIIPYLNDKTRRIKGSNSKLIPTTKFSHDFIPIHKFTYFLTSMINNAN